MKKRQFQIQTKNGQVKVNEEELQKEVKQIDSLSPYELNKVLTKQKAKELYIVHSYSIDRIHKILEIPISTLDNWINQGDKKHLAWKTEKQVYLDTVVDRIKKEKADILTDCLGLSVDILRRGLFDINSKAKALSLTELRKVKEIMDSLYKNVNLELGKPTTITTQFKGTKDELKDLLEELKQVDDLEDWNIVQ